MRFLSIFILLLCLRAQATTVVISDIDDTIRQTNVHNLGSLAILKNTEFAGMATLYDELLKSFTEIDYVTGNPPQLQGPTNFFLAWNQFPQGGVFFRQAPDDTVTHKIKAISGIFGAKKPDLAVMFGDNGEQDPITYSKLNEKYPGKTVSFIHQLYDNDVAPEQNPWLTSIDLAADLFSKNLLSSDGFDHVLEFALPKLLSTNRLDQEKVFPSWGECRLFFKNYSRPRAGFSSSQLEKLNNFESYLKNRCS